MKSNNCYCTAAMILLGLLACRNSTGQGTTYVSNLDRPSVGSLAVGSDSWYAADFSTGKNAEWFVLNSVQLKMTNATGFPSDFLVTIHTNYNPTFGRPGASLGELVGSSDPASPGIYTYTPLSPITLYGHGALYYIVVTAGTAVAEGAYRWNTVSSYTYNPDGWGAAYSYNSINGLAWIPNNFSPQFAVNATGTPEPTTGLFFFMAGFLAVGSRYQRQDSGSRIILPG